MEIKCSPDLFFVFDLDDTLFQEIDFLESAYRAIAAELSAPIGRSIYDEMLERYRKKENVFGWIISEFGELLPDIDLQWFLKSYREHRPEISLSKETRTFLEQVRKLGIPMGLITDGRSITQRNKLRSLGIEDWFEDIIISEEFGSEKPDERNYLHFQHKYPGKLFYFFGDNTRKDFIIPLKLGWKTVCLKDTGRHIHPQQLDTESKPEFIIEKFHEIALC